ncbi:hypothetical protein BLNAU_8153 [Blattamonas nauphoetae]|uniref:DDE-1 domain-containing protein n=1 Tax=Blattamonas nauphoetae TaxID=2049346 RepID=A0ABQ9XZH0_9EUKA|nr:hypothetical protein BLNAU_8153 [Blattamonas nauphoetae]
MEGLELHTDNEYGESQSGGMNSDLFQDWLERTFIPIVQLTREIHNTPNQKAILLADNCSSHITDAILALCSTNRTQMITPPGNTTHLLQILRRGQHHDTIECLVALAESALNKTARKVTVRRAFEKGGIVWNKSKTPPTGTIVSEVFKDVYAIATQEAEASSVLGTRKTRKTKKRGFGVVTLTEDHDDDDYEGDD